ncbi:biotin--[acetyl-CoA-carboxylase] ligase [Nocardioides sp. TRM66260-LWL]|uniref:biotin--[acetyl-CoA-carboxylase] ligase n=1 Tax=Nocardioides sp. TRM66260-LWL TaxID=2874478 RepID=UPI001CC4E9B8|nr:biotin--[acetyl-CoA-carboxylase] ligase [Nocardioides sp. TRM66260-LWL]MBZ5733294.1 biotin--[acetyl-CoA-carboxylase] ligase [Nocardioides sp. TRM66260-LWL]
MTDDAAQRPFLDVPRLAAHRIEVVAETGSTNALAAERAREGAPDGAVVVAEHQTAGRGRLDRRWEAPAGAALTLSVVLRPDVPPARWPWLPLLAGVAVVETLAEHGFAARLKWPNDVLLGAEERKVAGLLVERVETPGGPTAVVGIGLNVSLTADELPVPTATSLALARPGEPAPDREALLLALVARLRTRHASWRVGGAAADALRQEYREACATLGRPVRVEMPGDRTLQGTAVDVDADGRLVLDDGLTRHPVGAGDVVHVRAADDAGSPAAQRPGVG